MVKRSESNCPSIGTVLVIVAVALICCWAGTVQAEDPQSRNWGVGWDDGPTLRKWFGYGWEFGLSGGPNDFRDQNERWVWDSTGSPTIGNRYLVSRDDTQESGWVKAKVARPIFRRGRFFLAVSVALEYYWWDRQETSVYWDLSDEGYDQYRTDHFTDRWSLFGALRPSYEVTDWVTVEFDFGLVYRWRDDSVEEISVIAGESGAIQEKEESEYSNFDTFGGWWGLGSLQVVFWF